MANIYKACYYGGMVAAILLLVVTIILFFVLKIPKVFGELTGSSARKEVKSLKEKGVRKNPDGKNEPKHYSQRTGAIKTRTTDAPSEELSKKENTTSGLIRGKDKKKRTYHLDENETEFLGESKITAAVTGDIAETAVLSQNEVEEADVEFVNTDNLKSDKARENEAAATQVDEEATEVLQDNNDIEAEALTDKDDTQASDTDDYDPDGPTDVLTTDVEAEDDDEATEVLATEDDDEATEVLASEDEDEATEVLAAEDDDEATEILAAEDDDEATIVLTSDSEGDEYGETSVLSVSETKKKTKNYVVLYNVLEVHTSEKL